MLVFSVVFMGFASTLAQSESFATPESTEFSFSNELSEEELAEIDGENPVARKIVEVVGTYAVTKVVEAVPTKNGTSNIGKDVSEALDKGFKAVGNAAKAVKEKINPPPPPPPPTPLKTHDHSGNW